MPPSGIKAPAVAQNIAYTEWRRSPAKPVTMLKGSAYHHLHSAKPYPREASQELLYAVGVDTARLCRSRGVSPR